MSSDDQAFIAELTAWLGPEGESRESRKQLLASTGVVSGNTLTSILKGRYNASPKLRIGVRAQMTLLDQEALVSAQQAQSTSKAI